MKKTLLAAAVAVLLGQGPIASAQTAPWRVVIGDNSTVTVPGLPAGSRSVTDEILGDVGKGYIGVRVTSPDAAQGYWTLRQGTWTQYTKYGVTGAQGPGRTGADATNVFSSINTGGSGAGADGQRVFIARAGVPNDNTTATWGVWRWDTTKNVEIARSSIDSGALSPNIGEGWVYQNQSDTFSSARALNGGQVLINAYTLSPTGGSNLYMAKAVPGQNATPCAMLRNSTNRNLAPGLADGDYFDTTWGMGDLTVTTDNRVYGALSASSGSGIWELCSGAAPRAIVRNNEAGARGPDIGIATAVFTGFDPAYPGNPGSIYFFASFRPTSSDSSRTGLFWHDGTSAKPMAMNDDAGQYGPNWRGSTWNSFNTSSLTSAGDYAAFQASVRTTDSTVSGLWRAKAGGSPELVALTGGLLETGPEPGRSWDVFYGNAVLANGDIVAEARTQPQSEYAVWLLKKDGTKLRLLKKDQAVSVPTASGIAQATVNSYSIDNGAAPYSRGGDYWIGSDGSLLVHASLATYGETMITTALPNPIDKIFANGFDG